jgi:serine O-acetyltransferase
VIGRKARVGANSVVISAVPEGRTVVGIPGKVVHSSNMPREKIDGIDLNHHLMPDPVAEAVHCLLERIRLLEQQVGIYGCLPDGKSIEDECDHCDAKQVCEPESVTLKEVG